MREDNRLASCTFFIVKCITGGSPHPALFFDGIWLARVSTSCVSSASFTLHSKQLCGRPRLADRDGGSNPNLIKSTLPSVSYSKETLKNTVEKKKKNVEKENGEIDRKLYEKAWVVYFGLLYPWSSLKQKANVLTRLSRFSIGLKMQPTILLLFHFLEDACPEY